MSIIHTTRKFLFSQIWPFHTVARLVAFEFFVKYMECVQDASDQSASDSRELMTEWMRLSTFSFADRILSLSSVKKLESSSDGIYRLFELLLSGNQKECKRISQEIDFQWTENHAQKTRLVKLALMASERLSVSVSFKEIANEIGVTENDVETLLVEGNSCKIICCNNCVTTGVQLSLVSCKIDQTKKTVVFRYVFVDQFIRILTPKSLYPAYIWERSMGKCAKETVETESRNERIEISFMSIKRDYRMNIYFVTQYMLHQFFAKKGLAS